MKIYLAILVVALSAIVVGVVSSVSAVASSSAGQINVTATLTHTSGAKLGPFGRAGDTQRQRWRLSDRFGRSIGRMYFSCTWVVSQARLCTVEIQMPQGKITAAGSSPTVFEGEYAVTGGTGRYRGGGGVMLYQAIGLRKSVLRVEVTT